MIAASQPNLFDWLRLLVDVATPVAILLLGILAKRYADKIGRRRMLFEVGSNWRVRVFQQLLSHFNSIFCYYTYQGEWRSMSPSKVVGTKRAADRLVHMNQFLWSTEFMDAYQKFTISAFAENQGPGRDFLLRANVERHQENPGWKSSWAGLFVAQDQRIRRKDFKAVYNRMLSLAVRYLQIMSDAR